MCGEGRLGGPHALVIAPCLFMPGARGFRGCHQVDDAIQLAPAAGRIIWLKPGRDHGSYPTSVTPFSDARCNFLRDFPSTPGL